MRVPLEITFRDVPSSPAIQRLVHAKARKLDRFGGNIVSCRVAVERPQRHQRAGNPFRVRVEVTMPPGRDLVVARNPGDHEMHDTLPMVIRSAFEAMERRVKKVAATRRSSGKDKVRLS